MKRILLIASAVAIVAGCAKVTTVDTAEPQEIAFKAYNYAATKAGFYGPIDGSNYPEEESFGVFALYDSQTAAGTPWTDMDDVEMYIDDVEFIYDGTSTWKGNPTYFWPKQGSLVFAAYSPYRYYDGTEINANFSTTSGIYITSFNNPSYTYGQTQEQVDFMWFDVNLSQPVNSGTYTAQFKHALTNVVFSVIAKDDNSAKAIKLKKITMKNVNTIGDFTSGNSNPSWRNPSTPKDNTAFSSDEGFPISTDETFVPSEKKGILVIPQNVVSFEIDYAIGYDYDNATGSYKKYLPQRYTYTPDASLTWPMGYRYTYNITLGVDEITITPSVKDWIPEADVEVPVQ